MDRTTLRPGSAVSRLGAGVWRRLGWAVLALGYAGVAYAEECVISEPSPEDPATLVVGWHSAGTLWVLPPQGEPMVEVEVTARFGSVTAEWTLQRATSGSAWVVVPLEPPSSAWFHPSQDAWPAVVDVLVRSGSSVEVAAPVQLYWTGSGPQFEFPPPTSVLPRDEDGAVLVQTAPPAADGLIGGAP